MKLPTMPKPSAKLMRKGAIPFVLLSALTSHTAVSTLSQLEGDILKVYPDRLANNIPTYCAGRTDWSAQVGTVLTQKVCDEVNKVTLVEYGFAILECATWKYLDADRLIGLTLFAINVGKKGACSSSAMGYINYGRIAEGCRLIAYKQDGSPNWSYAAGKYIPGLFKRRKIESSLCLKGLT